MDWGPQYAAFLDQARWGLAAQQQRSATFVTSAGTVLGFDGIILAVFASARAMDGLVGVSLWFARASGVMVTLSAALTLGALIPRKPASVDWTRVIRAWADLHDPNASERQDSRQLFPQLILAVGPVTTPRPRPSVLAWRTRSDKPLESTAEMATSRGNWFAASVIALLVGLVLLLVSALGGTVTSEPSADQPQSPTNSITSTPSGG